jgi:RNA polymerase sigma-70 factor (ECF subfamily)
MTPDGITKLILRTSLRDRAAFDLLYRHTSAKLFGVCLRVLNDRGEAEDALQEVYVKIWAKADRFAVSQLSPISWLVAVARNHAIDRLRSRRPPAVELGAALDVADPGLCPEAMLLARERTRSLDRGIDTLGTQKADALRGAYLDGHSYAELAERHNVPLNTMRTWLRRGLLKVRESIEA